MNMFYPNPFNDVKEHTTIIKSPTLFNLASLYPKGQWCGLWSKMLLTSLLIVSTLAIQAQTTWTGTTDTDWATPTNWSAGVPDAADDVTIPNTTNKPTIGAGTAAAAKTIEVQTGTTLTIAAMASLTVNGSKSVPSGGTTALLNDGTVQNNGQLILGNLSAIGGEGLYNRGTFNNNSGGDIKIDRSTYRAILNRDATFNNSGLITIGASASVGERGLNNFGATAMFNNNTGGEIKIDNATNVGLYNESGTFTNVAKITIGATASVGGEGIANAGTFNNNTGGDIKIDRSTYRAILNINATFNNSALITIGSLASVGQRGLNNFGATSQFNNNTGGEIKIDNATEIGLFNESGTFINTAKITIGATTSVGARGVDNKGTFSNNTGGEIKIDNATTVGLFNESGTFTNTAKITIGATTSVGSEGIANAGTFNNNTGGDIKIDRSTFRAIWNINATFNNSALITIGSLASVGERGLNNFGATSQFNNNTGGEIKIDNATNVGLFNESGTFTNAAKITIGATASIGNSGIENNAAFNNNTGGNIKIDRTGGSQAFYTSGIVNNEATIEIGSTAAVTGLGVAIESGTGIFNNKTGSLLTINRSTKWGMENKGTLDNSGTIRVGNIAFVGAICIVHRNGGTFINKTGGAIYMDRTTAGGQALYSSGLFNNQGDIKIGSNADLNGEGIRIDGNTFNNEALIEIGSQADVKGFGIRNGGGSTFNNKVGGEIRINRIGILNTDVIGAILNIGTFTNDAMITVGNIGLVSAQDGVQNVGGSFTNSATGIISIEKTWGNGIWHYSGTFQNAGKITIRNVFNYFSGTYSTGILSYAPFTNTTGAQIHLDQVANGIISTRAFTNAGLIRMGENGPLTGSGIANIQGVNAVFNNNAGGDISIKQTAVDGVQNDALSTFNNNACAKLTIFDNLNNAGTFTNAGLFTVNTTQAHTNSALTNNGIIEYPQGNPIPNVTNNDVIIAPITVCYNNSIITPALQIGGANSFNIGTTWYKESTLTTPAGTYSPNTFTITSLAGVSTYPLYFEMTDAANMCTRTTSITVTVNPLPTASISGTTVVCKDASSPSIIFTGASATAPYTFTYKINNGPDLTVTSTGTTAIVSAPTGTAGTFVYSLVSVKDASTTQCSQNQSGTATVSVNIKPVFTLSSNTQTFIEGSAAVLCDLDDNPTNVLTTNVITGCVAGNVVWRTQIGVSGWSDWSSTAPTTQPSNNTLYRYQAACEGSCEVTYSGVISLTINYRATMPLNVSLVADGTTVAVGEEKVICDQAGNALTFNATCATGERLIYSVDGGVYLPEIPSQMVDGNFHNYRVRCQKSDGTVSCVETESGVIRLKINTINITPVASLSVNNSCGTPLAFSGTANCGSLTTVWYNATTNVALPNLPNTTPNETTSYYARCQGELSCQSGVSNTVTFTVTPVNDPPVISSSAEIVCTGVSVTVSANCPAGSTAFWNTGVSTNSFQVSFNNVTRQTYWASCVFANGCQSPESIHKDILWKAFDLTFINIGQSQSAIKAANDRNLWSSQFITADGGPVLENSTEANPTIYHSENLNKTAPRFWTIQVETCALGGSGSVTYDMLAKPEVGVVRSYNTHENNAPYFMYANREGYTELYAQNHPAYGFYLDNGAGGNVYDAGLPKGLYKLGIRYWDQKGQGSIYPSTRQPAGTVLAYQEYWFRIQSKDGVGVGAARVASDLDSYGMTKGAFASVMPNPVSSVLRLKVTDAKAQKVNVSLLDASGRTLLQRNFVPETNQHQEEFNVSELANGMYFLKVNAGEKQATLKVIKVE